MSRTTSIWVGVTLLLIVVGFVGGRALRPGGPSGALTTNSPAFEAVPIAGLSQGGFSGSEDVPAPNERTVVAGRVVSVNPDAIVIQPPAGAPQTLRLSGQGPLMIIEPATIAAIRPGASVIVRRTSENQAAALLVVAP